MPRQLQQHEIDHLADRFQVARRRKPQITLLHYLQDPLKYEIEYVFYLHKWKRVDLHIMDHRVHLN